MHLKPGDSLVQKSRADEVASAESALMMMTTTMMLMMMSRRSVGGVGGVPVPAESPMSRYAEVEEHLDANGSSKY
jgi:hypothetical protein